MTKQAKKFSKTLKELVEQYGKEAISEAREVQRLTEEEWRELNDPDWESGEEEG